MLPRPDAPQRSRLPSHRRTSWNALPLNWPLWKQKWSRAHPSPAVRKRAGSHLILSKPQRSCRPEQQRRRSMSPPRRVKDAPLRELPLLNHSRRCARHQSRLPGVRSTRICPRLSVLSRRAGKPPERQARSGPRYRLSQRLSYPRPQFKLKAPYRCRSRRAICRQRCCHAHIRKSSQHRAWNPPPKAPYLLKHKHATCLPRRRSQGNRSRVSLHRWVGPPQKRAPGRVQGRARFRLLRTRRISRKRRTSRTQVKRLQDVPRNPL